MRAAVCRRYGPPDVVAPMAAGVSYSEAAALAGATALWFLRDKAFVRPGAQSWSR
jgi:hypothetical protein